MQRNALFRLAFAAAPCRRHLTKLHIATRRFIMQKARRHPLPSRRTAIGLRLTVGKWFQVLLTPLIGVLFIVHSRYLFTIGRDIVFSLGRWTSRFHTEFHGFRATLEHPEKFAISPTGLSPCIVRLSRLFGCRFLPRMGARNPDPAGPVWAVPISLAATDGISVDFFSCRYLDVSVLCVRSRTLCIQVPVTLSACTVVPGCPIRKSSGQSSFDNSPRLIAAYHVLHRLITPRHPPFTLTSLTTIVPACNAGQGRSLMRSHGGKERIPPRLGNQQTITLMNLSKSILASIHPSDEATNTRFRTMRDHAKAGEFYAQLPILARVNIFFCANIYPDG